ncbi:hypothetical protein RIF29_21068 [Crotalaria pallida]|uniref:Uncharacterized protein n=1 Tax=Crotalaria pallida TaxID=3830 RepID=A0AAN9F4M9_CROPI
MRRAPGRPKKQRRKTNDEPRNPYKLPKQNKTTRCSERGTLGHNKTSCKGKTAAVPLIGSYRRVVIRRITGSKGQQLHHSKKKRQKHKNHKHKKGKHNLFKHNPAKHQL